MTDKRKASNHARDLAIVAAVMAGETQRSLAVRYKISYQRVNQVLRTSGVPASQHGNPWTDAEIAHVKDRLKRGMPMAHAAPAGKSRNRVAYLAKRLGIWKRTQDSTPWSDAETAYLSEHHMTSSASKIGKHLGRTKNEVLGKARRMGLKKGTNEVPEVPWSEADIAYLMENLPSLRRNSRR